MFAVSISISIDTFHNIDLTYIYVPNTYSIKKIIVITYQRTL